MLRFKEWHRLWLLLSCDHHMIRRTNLWCGWEIYWWGEVHWGLWLRFLGSGTGDNCGLKQRFVHRLKVWRTWIFWLELRLSRHRNGFSFWRSFKDWFRLRNRVWDGNRSGIMVRYGRRHEWKLHTHHSQEKMECKWWKIKQIRLLHWSDAYMKSQSHDFWKPLPQVYRFLYECFCDLWPWSTKAVLSHWGIFVAIANNTLYGSKLLIFLLCQKSLGY